MGQPAYPGLEVDEDLAFQRGAWVVQRVAWSLFAAIIVAALLGLFGRGLLSSAESSAGGGDLSASYDRVARILTPTTLEVTLPVDGDEVKLWVDRQYLDRMGLQDVHPDPDSVEGSAERWTYTFKPAPDATELVVIFQLKPQSVGKANAKLGAEGGPGLDFSQLVLP